MRYLPKCDSGELWCFRCADCAHQLLTLPRETNRTCSLPLWNRFCFLFLYRATSSKCSSLLPRRVETGTSTDKVLHYELRSHVSKQCILAEHIFQVLFRCFNARVRVLLVSWEDSRVDSEQDFWRVAQSTGNLWHVADCSQPPSCTTVAQVVDAPSRFTPCVRPGTVQRGEPNRSAGLGLRNKPASAISNMIPEESDESRTYWNAT